MNSENNDLNVLLNTHFAGKVVRKDLTKLIKEGANVPTYVLEYLLGMYCASDDEDVIQQGLEKVKRILADNYVRPDEAEKIKSIIKERGEYKIIDKVEVKLNEHQDCYEAILSNTGIKGVHIGSEFVKKYEKLLVGGIWSIITMRYMMEDEEKKKTSPFTITEIKPIQMPNVDLDSVIEGRKGFTEDQWIDVLLRSSGMEPANLENRVKWHLLNRMVPFVENNYNCCELGPRGTGKSHIYKEISPNSILVSGGQTSVANLFYNMSRRTVGLVGLWDVVAFDEVAGISFKDKDGVQIMKDYMASGSFARGREAIQAKAGMVFVGNINQPLDVLIKTSHLFAPFPEAMIDTAFFDRFHSYIPGWEIPKMRPEFFTDQYGLIVDYFSGFMRELRKFNFADAINKYFKLGKDLNQRDTIAVKHTVSGLLKLLYPGGDYDKAAVEKCLIYALEARRRVKEQLKKIGGMEFYDVHFSYIDQETFEEKFVNVPEQGGDKLIPEGILTPGQMYSITEGKTNGHLGLYRFETQVTPGNGKLDITGMTSNTQSKEQLKVGFEYFKINASRLSASVKPDMHDFHLHVVEMHNTGAPQDISLTGFIALVSAVTNRPVQAQMIILGNMSLGGTISPVSNLAEILQVAFDSGAKKILLPTSNMTTLQSVPPELLSNFQVSWYSDPVDAAFKALD